MRARCSCYCWVLRRHHVRYRATLISETDWGKWGQERPPNCVGSMWRGPRGSGGEGSCGGGRMDCAGLCAAHVTIGWEMLGGEASPTREARKRSAHPSLCTQTPWNQPRWWTAVVEKLWRSEIRSVSSFGEIRATHASPLGKSSVFILLSWRQRPSGGNVRDPPGQWPDGQSIWMYMKWSLPTLRCEVPGHGIMHAVQILLISHWGGKLDARGGERPCTL